MEQEKTTYQKASEAHESMETEYEEFDKTKDAFLNAQRKYNVAVEEFKHLMEEGRKEDTLELRRGAYEEHEAVLLRELEEAISVKDFTRAAVLANNLAAVKENQKNIVETLEAKRPEELMKTIEGFLERHHVAKKEDQAHYKNRAWILFSSVFIPITDFNERLIHVEISLEREFADATKHKPHVVPDWADRPKHT